MLGMHVHANFVNNGLNGLHSEKLESYVVWHEIGKNYASAIDIAQHNRDQTTMLHNVWGRIQAMTNICSQVSHLELKFSTNLFNVACANFVHRCSIAATRNVVKLGEQAGGIQYRRRIEHLFKCVTQQSRSSVDKGWRHNTADSFVSVSSVYFLH